MRRVAFVLVMSGGRAGGEEVFVGGEAEAVVGLCFGAGIDTGVWFFAVGDKEAGEGGFRDDVKEAGDGLLL